MARPLRCSIDDMTEGNAQSGTAGPRPSPDWEALARYLSGESTPGEAARIESALAEHPADRDVLTALDSAMSRMSDDIPMDLDIEGALSRVKARRSSATMVTDLRSERRRRAQAAEVSGPGWRVPLPAVAAAALLVVVTGSWIALRDRQPDQGVLSQPRMLATGVGVRDSLTLPDGSRVILGPLSSVSMSSGYGFGNREVVVRGDAWFDVVHDVAKPFTVRAAGATIVDVGTRFAVRSDAADGVSVSVTEGSVSLRSESNPAPHGVILKAGDNALLQKGGQVIARRGTVTEDDFAWMRGRLVFREAPVEEVIVSLRRWYGIELRVDSSLMNRHITATFGGESADRVLEVLHLILGAEIDRRGDTAMVLPAGWRAQSR